MFRVKTIILSEQLLIKLIKLPSSIKMTVFLYQLVLPYDMGSKS